MRGLSSACFPTLSCTYVGFYANETIGSTYRDTFLTQLTDLKPSPSVNSTCKLLLRSLDPKTFEAFTYSVLPKIQPSLLSEAAPTTHYAGLTFTPPRTSDSASMFSPSEPRSGSAGLRAVRARALDVLVHRPCLGSSMSYFLTLAQPLGDWEKQ